MRDETASAADAAARPASATAGADAGPEATAQFLGLILVLAFAMNTVGRGVTETFAVFLLPVEQGLSASRSAMTATYSIYMLAHGAAAPFAGQIIDRAGARVTYGLGLAILGLGYVAAGSATTVWHYYLTVGLMGGLGASCLGMVIASSLLARWFTKRFGSVMSLPYAAVGAGMLVLPPLTQILLDTYGWRAAHRILGVGILLLLPFVLALPLSRISAGAPSWQAQRAANVESGLAPWTLGEAMRTTSFWGLFGAYLATAVAAYAVLPQSVAYLVEQGFAPLTAAGAFGVTGALSAVGIIAIAALSDRVGALRAATLSYVSTILGIVALLLVAVWPSMVLVWAYVFFFGSMQGVRGPIIVALVATLFRGGKVGSIFGALSVALGLGASAGSWASGLLRDATGTYVASFLLAIAGALVGMALFWMVRGLRLGRELPQPARTRGI